MSLRIGSTDQTVYHTGNFGASDVTFSGGTSAVTIAANSDIRFGSGSWTSIPWNLSSTLSFSTKLTNSSWDIPDLNRKV